MYLGVADGNKKNEVVIRCLPFAFRVKPVQLLLQDTDRYFALVNECNSYANGTGTWRNGSATPSTNTRIARWPCISQAADSDPKAKGRRLLAQFYLFMI